MFRMSAFFWSDAVGLLRRYDTIMIQPMGRRIRIIALWLGAAVLLWCVVLGVIVWDFGARDRVAQSDCILVLGAAVRGAEASPVFEERIRHGIHLYHAGYAPKMLFTGGTGEGQKHPESSVGRFIAMQQGVPEGDILTEDRSRTTKQNLEEARLVMRQHGLGSAIIVSDPLHMKRAMMMADGLGIAAVSSPTPTTRYRSFRTRLGFLLREIYFIHHYLVTGD
jgi:uncharacterized SAM-binding protein YcdF (DUF218 family)